MEVQVLSFALMFSGFSGDEPTGFLGASPVCPPYGGFRSTSARLRAVVERDIRARRQKSLCGAETIRDRRCLAGDR